MSKELELTRPQPRPLAPISINVESLLEKAIDARSAVEVMQALQVMRREMKEEQAKEMFDSSLRDFQAECPVIEKAKHVPDSSGKTAYAYAPLESIIAAVKPLLQKHGFSFQLDTDVESKDGWVIAKCHVTHCAGHCRTSTAKFPLGTGTRIMSATQVYAAALTFASRRVFCNAFGIITSGEDQDGGAKPKPVGPSTKQPDNTNVRELATLLWKLLPADVAGKNPNWKHAKQFLVDNDFITPEEHGGDDRAPFLSVERYGEVINKLKNR